MTEMAFSVRPVMANPGGTSTTWSPWLFQTLRGEGKPASSREDGRISSSAKPYSRRPAGSTLPPSL